MKPTSKYRIQVEFEVAFKDDEKRRQPTTIEVRRWLKREWGLDMKNWPETVHRPRSVLDGQSMKYGRFDVMVKALRGEK